MKNINKIDYEHFFDFIFLTKQEFQQCYSYMTIKEVESLYKKYKNIPIKKRKKVIIKLAKKLLTI